MNRSAIPTTTNGSKHGEVRLPKSKWVRGASASSPISAIAKRAVRSRLKLVPFYAPLAARKAHANIEYVHQLRVVTRRASAALDTFEAVLPQRRARQVSEILRELRRAAGAARDLDVLGMRLIQEKPLPADLSLAVLQWISRCRSRAQKRLVRAHRCAQQCRYKRRTKSLARRIRWRNKSPEPTLSQTAPALLRPSAQGLLDCAVTGAADIASLHKMRIAVKRLRYTMELLANGFSSVFQEELYPLVEDLAARLGQLNDHATACEFYQRARRKQPELAQLATLADYETEQLERCKEGLLQWWTQTQASDLERHLRALLAASAD